MSRMQMDLVDLPAGILFFLGAFTQLGILSPNVPVLGWDISDAIWSFSASGATVSLSVAIFISLIGLGWAVWSNELGFRGWSGLQLWVVAVTFWLVIAPPFVPILDAVLMGSEWAKLVALSVQSMGFVIVSYLG